VAFLKICGSYLLYFDWILFTCRGDRTSACFQRASNSMLCSGDPRMRGVHRGMQGKTEETCVCWPLHLLTPASSSSPTSGESTAHSSLARGSSFFCGVAEQ